VGWKELIIINGTAGQAFKTLATEQNKNACSEKTELAGNYLRRATPRLQLIFKLPAARKQFTKHRLWLQVATFLAAGLALPPASAQTADNRQERHPKVIETWIEEWDPNQSCWIRVDDPTNQCSSNIIRPTNDEIVYPLPRFGPFLMLNANVALQDGSTDSQTPKHFVRMLETYSEVRQINFIDASGTVDDVANLRVGRMIRAAELTTHVPNHGSARSGAVELFLAGTNRTMEEGARFAVHAWRDRSGRGPTDFDEHHPINMLYIDYYMEMGMTHDKAHAFYNFTNSAPHSEALWFGPAQMQFWLEP